MNNMKKSILFEGKVVIAGQVVDFRIYKIEDGGMTYYTYDINPELRDEHQMDFSNGESKMEHDLESLLFRFGIFKGGFSHIVETRPNVDF